MELELAIATVGNIAASVMLLALTIFVFLNNPKRLINRLFALGAGFVTFFGFFFATAINLEPSAFAHSVWMLSIIDVGMVVFFFHLAFVLVGTEEKAKWLIRGTYGVGLAIVLAALVMPQLFIPEVTPKLFTKSYPNAGPIFAFMFLYFNYVLITLFVTLIRGYSKVDKARQGQIEYFALTLLTGFGFGSTGFALVFNLPVSPVFTMLFGVCLIPLAYGIVAKQMLDIRIVFKKALIFSVSIGLITAFLLVLILINDYLASHISWVKWWTTPVITAFIAFFVGRLYFKKSIENERLKYEFITVAAHKLRTPLTQISWGVRELLENAKDEETRSSALHIQRSTNRLIELTNIIFETTAASDSSSFDYSTDRVDLRAVTREVYDQFESIAQQKNIHIIFGLADTPLYINADERRIRSVVEVLIENALNYTPKDGKIELVAYEKDKTVFFSVRDTGIGISSADRKHVFSRFYRSDAAKRADTEGVGLGLAMAKNIIEKHRGKISVDSEGEGKGATFWFSLPKR